MIVVENSVLESNHQLLIELDLLLKLIEEHWVRQQIELVMMDVFDSNHFDLSDRLNELNHIDVIK